ncbi:MAG: T9SS type A sorting domain-containing protein [Bacteroidetes bacterium]|nr:T9SS type A sorting domain-containing protein [Bacteroidota bacterium]
MKRIFIFIACAICACNGFSQYDANWTFGDGTGLFFSEDTIIPFESSISGFEAQASISDSSGNLLFYTNGQNVWNREHELMPNGTGLKIGKLSPDSAFGSSITQGVIILPMPLSERMYYIFYNKDNALENGLDYCVVDMDAESGLGDVIEKNITILERPTTEKMQAVQHANGRDWWLMIHSSIIITDEDWPDYITTFLITPSGIEGPFDQEPGFETVDDDNYNGLGQMKFNRQGNMLAYTRGKHVELADFDRCTGLLSNWYTIKNVHEYGTYGCEFSPDGTKLYITGGIVSPSNNTQLYQYCLNCKDEIIDSTKQLIYKENFEDFKLGQLQLGTNNRIFIAMTYIYPDYIFSFQNMNLSIINTPNNIGLSSDFDTLTLSLNGKGVKGGLPNMPNYNLGALAGSGCDTVISGVINSEQLKNAITFYPNPAYDYIIISGDINANDILKIYSADGRVVLQEKINTTNTKVDISKLPPGVYVIQISEDGLVKYSEKLFK